LQQRLQAELVEDGGVRELTAALARDERGLRGRLQADREQRRDRGDEAVEHDRDAALGRRQRDPGQQRDLRPAEGRRQHARVAQLVAVGGTRPADGAGDDIVLALDDRGVGAGAEADGGLGRQVEEHAGQCRRDGGVADAHLAQADKTMLGQAASEGSALLDESVHVVETQPVGIDQVARGPGRAGVHRRHRQPGLSGGRRSE
jgi:hypothetical protein